MSGLWIVLLGAGLGLYVATAWWHSRKPLPSGLKVTGPWRDAGDSRLLLDETFLDADGQRHCRQQIVDEWLRLIGQARRLVMIDIFQFNDPADSPPDCHRRVSFELVDALLARKREMPELEIVLITDPINTAYGGHQATHLTELRAAGAQVIITRLSASRDPNPTWNALWRLAIRQWGNTTRNGWLPNPVGPGRATLRSYLAALNLNANHRKTLVVDDGDGWRAIVSSANLDDGSSDYRDLALTLSGSAALDLMASEAGIAGFSGASGLTVPTPPPAAQLSTATPRLRILSEGAIRDALLHTVETAQPGEQLDIETLYLSHRGMIKALLGAHRRGVAIRVLLDPNKAHFGRPSPGIPNRQASRDLHEAGIAVRWSDTRGEQAHGKLLLRSGGNRPATLLAGSANLTRRSLDDLNLELNVQLEATLAHPAIDRARDAFERHWHNTSHEHYSTTYAAHADPSRLRYWRYRAMEASGWCVF
ncbi:phospholipase D-like domain-containing protein [Billgrantia endophytica]|uniref:Phospholipase n=1 Tax=Billgrantia endophytica TaxID=2033802 RepID=A0A2N7U073_9GAMM|nr:phospholipase D-like domain-containing protein [Halomonas endophytica]PMR73813.1 phospholipase [Halomonas endophytica]